MPSKSPVKVTPKALDTDTLLDLVEKAPDDKAIMGEKYKNDVLGFLSTFNIQPGEDTIKGNTLYSIYKVWSKEPLPKNTFYREVNNFLPEKTPTFYKINQNVIKLTHEAYSRFKQERNIKLKNKTWTRHFEDFLLYYSLKTDNFWIEGPILYFIYDKYAHERGLDKHNSTHMNLQTFYAYADLFLKYKKTKTGKYYAVSDNITIQFQEGQLERMQREYAKEQKAKEKPKKRRRKPRPKARV